MREKKKKKIFIVLVLLFSNVVLAQQEDQIFICGVGDTTFYRDPEDRGGLHTPSEGNLKAIVVFIKFKDDNYPSNGWPLGNFPDWARDIMDPEPGEPFLRTNLSHYFHEMSNGIFEIYGYVHPEVMVTYQDEDDYGSNGLKYVNQEILTRLDPYLNYSDYDNFTGNNPGTDDIVDMIFLIYRRFDGPLIGYPTGEGWTGNASLILPNDLSFDGVTIKAGFPGSGIQQRGGYNGETYTMYQAAHEFCHYEFGGGHIPGNSNLSIMNGGPAWNASRGMHPWEREKLDWIDYQDKSGNDIIYVTDYYTTDDVYRIPVSSTEYFLIANHQKISPHDWAKDKGIYIHHVSNSDYFPPLINVECADGNWEFSVDIQHQEVIRGRANRTTEEDELNFYRDLSGTGYFCCTPFYPANDAWGDAYDAFDWTFNNVFSPKSNPHSVNGGSLDFTIEVQQVSEGNMFQLQLFFTNPYSGKPSKPQNLAVEPSQNYHPYLTGDANQEPDVLSGGHYNIYKFLTETGWLYFSQTANTYFEDYDENYCTLPPKFCTSGRYIRYRVTAVDNSSKESVPSDSVRTYTTSALQQKINITPKNILPTAYSLEQNYPNPSTRIDFSIKKDGYVNLSVYDILGNEVANLVNERMTAGYYEVEFNASNFPSGIYFYRLQSGNYIETKKLILLK